ncbi:MAG: insulinase family protein [Deltaproteobacteria bacterium]|nr:insulinase family protein [Deltaproteobacteria bacterium]MBW2660491.1 insulinase family protein [Deltaproteobacteria bacterium]
MIQTVNKTVLQNGIRVLTKKMPDVRSVSMGIWVNVGARDEGPAENGLSHFIEHMVFKGTKKRSAFQIAKEFDAIGGHSNAFTGMENTCFHAKVMDTHIETLVDILSDIFLNSVFNPKEVENERQVILQEIGMAEDSPEEHIHILTNNNFWGDDSLGRSILGSPENITAFDAEAIKDFFYRFYQPEYIVISVAGNVEHNHIINLIDHAFESVASRKELPERTTPKSISSINMHYRDLEQVHICIGTKGLSATDEQRYAFSLMNTILGGNMSSRLFQEIREQRGLAYSVYSFASSLIDTGMFGIYAGVNPENTQVSTELILNEMRKMKEKQVSSTELHNAKEYTKGNLLLASESNDNQMVRLARNEIQFRHYIPMQEIVNNIDAVSKDDILNLAGNLFQSKHLSLTSLGPVKDNKLFKNGLTL